MSTLAPSSTLAYRWAELSHAPYHLVEADLGPPGYLMQTRCKLIYHAATIVHAARSAHLPTDSRCPICFVREAPPTPAPPYPELDPLLWGFDVGSFSLDSAHRVGWWEAP